MIKKSCPWCFEKTTLNQLGRRPVQKNDKWYQFSKSVQVCPYCAGPVKLGGNAIWFMALTAPIFLSVLIELLTGFNVLDRLGASEIGWVLFLFGCAATLYFSIFTKVE